MKAEKETKQEPVTLEALMAQIKKLKKRIKKLKHSLNGLKK
jgi:hypothetical protein